MNGIQLRIWCSLALMAPSHWTVENLKLQKPRSQRTLGEGDFKEEKRIWPSRSPPYPLGIWLRHQWRSQQTKSNQSQTLLLKKKKVYVCITSLKKESADFLLCVFSSCFLVALILDKVVSTMKSN